MFSFYFHITSSKSKSKSRVNKTLQAFAELQLNVATLAAKMRKQRALRSPPAKLVVMGIYCAICPAQSPQYHSTTEPPWVHCESTLRRCTTSNSSSTSNISRDNKLAYQFNSTRSTTFTLEGIPNQSAEISIDFRMYRKNTKNLFRIFGVNSLIINLVTLYKAFLNLRVSLNVACSIELS